MLQVLRFSRLFRPTYIPHVWRKKKKKSEEEEGKKVKTEEEQKADALMSEDEKQKKLDLMKQEMEDEFEDYCPFQLNLGRDARPDELEADDAVRF